MSTPDVFEGIKAIPFEDQLRSHVNKQIIKANLLTFAHRRLIVAFLEGKYCYSAMTRLSNNPDTEQVQGATTHLYTAAKFMMCEQSYELYSPIDYILVTESDRMKFWAQSDDLGKRVFNWDSIATKKNLLFAEKKISA